MKFPVKSVLPLTLLLASGCMFVSAPSEEELNALNNPSEANQQWLASISPSAILWVSEQEKIVRKTGRKLTDAEIQIAKQMGVQHPEKVRVLVTDNFPLPTQQPLLDEFIDFGMGSPRVGGQAFGYSILIKPRYQGEDWLLSHELVHVAQMERMGFESFVSRYLLELKMLGYGRSPLELEANDKML